MSNSVRDQAIAATGIVGAADAIKELAPNKARALLIYAMSKGATGAAEVMGSLCSNDAERIAWAHAVSVYTPEFEGGKGVHGATVFYLKCGPDFNVNELVYEAMDGYQKDEVRALTNKFIKEIQEAD